MRQKGDGEPCGGRGMVIGIGGRAEERKGDVTGEQKGGWVALWRKGMVLVLVVALKRKGTLLVSRKEMVGLKRKGDGTVEEIGHDINTETSIDDDQEGEQLELEDKESAIYW